MKTVVITGISSGIGYATAENFLSKGWTVIGSVREIESVAALKNKFKEKLILWVIDLTSISEIDSIKSLLDKYHITQIEALVNNAGIAIPGPFQFQDFNEIQQTLSLNVLAVMKLTQVLIPFLISNQGRIINISSVSGVNGSPFLAGYCASKHAIEGFSESLRREMKIYGVQVIIVGPGSIKTPIWSKGFSTLVYLYDQTFFKKSFSRFIQFAQSEEKHALPVQAVVDDIADAIESEKPKIRYAPIPRKFRNWYLGMLIPRKKYDELICKSLALVENKKNL